MKVRKVLSEEWRVQTKNFRQKNHIQLQQDNTKQQHNYSDGVLRNNRKKPRYKQEKSNR